MAELHWGRWSLLCAALVISGCGEAAVGNATATATPPRAGRFGSLRDFVLFELPASAMPERWLFVDRFEVTRGDWREFAASPAGARLTAESAAILGDPALPAGLVSLPEARAFAVWRFARLPRLDEWEAVVRGDGRYTFPWGNKADATRANTAELGLLEPTPVGTFESGRREIGQPYDLIGNVSEWTETVPVEWCASTGAASELMSLPYAASWRTVLSTPALAVWQPMPGVMPAITAVASCTEVVPRAVVGADFQSSMLDPDKPLLARPEQVLGGDRRLRTGLRLMTTPRELLLALARDDVEPTVDDYSQLKRFVARGNHLAVLRAAWARVEPRLPATQFDSPLARWLRERLGR